MILSRFAVLALFAVDPPDAAGAAVAVAEAGLACAVGAGEAEGGGVVTIGLGCMEAVVDSGETILEMVAHFFTCSSIRSAFLVLQI